MLIEGESIHNLGAKSERRPRRRRQASVAVVLQEPRLRVFIVHGHWGPHAVAETLATAIIIVAMSRIAAAK